MKKWKKVICLTSIICLMFSLSTTVHAETRWFRFLFTNDTMQEMYYPGASKADNEQNWYLTLVEYDIESGISNSTLASNNKFGCKLHRSYSDYVDIYRIYNSYVTAKRIPYQTTVYQGDVMNIKGKKDNSSTSSVSLQVYGKYTP